MKAVIMAGGRGTRFWPLSREGRPKQFLDLFGSGRPGDLPEAGDSREAPDAPGQGTLLQRAMQRLSPPLAKKDVYVVCGRRYADAVSRQVPGMPRENIIVEPVGRNTAPCAALAAAYIRRRYAGESVALLPSDHLISRVDAFHKALEAADALAKEGWLVTFGIRPAFPATGYGYLKRGEPIGEFQGKRAFRVAEFVEKPDRAKAGAFLESGDYDWNSGMFVFTPEALLSEVEASLPELDQGLRRIAEAGFTQEAVDIHFPGLPSISIDYGVMEKARRVASIPCDLGWSDMGSWRALQELWPADERGLASNRPLAALDSRDVLVVGAARSDKMTALIGVEKLVVIDTPDALLICPADRCEEVKRIVENLERQYR